MTINEDYDDESEEAKKKILEEEANDIPEDEEKSNQLLSVTEACRLHAGYKTVRGVISSISELYKMASKVKLRCLTCGYFIEKEYDHPISLDQFSKARQACTEDGCTGNFELEHTYVNAVTIELRNPETFNDLDKMKVILFDDNSRDIVVGENALITGNIDVGPSSNSKKGSGKVSILYVRKIEYENHEDMSLTPADVEELQGFRAKHSDLNIIKELVSLFAHTHLIKH